MSKCKKGKKKKPKLKGKVARFSCPDCGFLALKKKHLCSSVKL